MQEYMRYHLSNGIDRKSIMLYTRTEKEVSEAPVFAATRSILFLFFLFVHLFQFGNQANENMLGT